MVVGGAVGWVMEKKEEEKKKERKRWFDAQKPEEREHIITEFKGRAFLYLGAIAKTNRKQTTSINTKGAVATTTTGTKQPLDTIATIVTDKVGLEPILTNMNPLLCTGS